MQKFKKFVLFTLSHSYLFIALSVLVIFILNSINLKPEDSYDYFAHFEMLEYYAKPWNFDLVAPDAFRFSYNAPLYYIVIGKIHFLIEYLSGLDFNPHYTARLVHIVWIFCVWVVFNFFLLKKLGYNNLHKFIFTLLFFLIPNIFLGQVMVRADHLGFLCLGLLIFFWFYFDFWNQLKGSWWRLIILGLLLIGIGNSRHILLFSFGLFGILALAACLKNAAIKKPSTYIFHVVFLVLVAVAGTHFYLIRTITTGSPTSFSSNDVYALNFAKREQYRPLTFKLEMLLNLEFDKLLQTPNRNAFFGANEAFSFKNISSEFFEKTLLPFMQTKTTRTDLFIKADNGYALNDSLPISDQVEAQAIAYGVININNSFLPRLVGDMWADHWLYFSGPKGTDAEVNSKQIILILAAPFTIFYFLGWIYSLRFLLKREFKKLLKIETITSIIFGGTLIIYTYFSVFSFSEPSKNSIIKFVYLSGIYYLPFFLFLSIIKKRKVFTGLLLVYLVIVFIAALPLYVY